MPVMAELNSGSLIIMGGTNESNEVVEDSWVYNSDSQCFFKAQMRVNISELRGCKAVTTTNSRAFVLAAYSS